MSSVGVIIGGLIIYFMGLNIVDSIVSAIIGIFILRGAMGILIESADILLEAVPKSVNLEEVVKDVGNVEGVREAHDVHIWTITSGMYALSAHILIDDLLVGRSGEILENINRMLKEKHNITHSTVQFECETCEEGTFVCRFEGENSSNKR